MYYASALLILAIISFGIYKQPALGLIPSLVMAYGDGFAAVCGKLIKSKEYKVFETTKTIAGSLTMFIISVIIIATYFIILKKPLEYIIISIIMALIVTIIEAIT